MDKTGMPYQYSPSSSGRGGMLTGSTCVSRVEAVYNEEESKTCCCIDHEHDDDDDCDDHSDKETTKCDKRNICKNSFVVVFILLCYALVGSLIFMIVEDETSFIYQYKIASYFTDQSQRSVNTTSLAELSQEFRAETVDKLWELVLQYNVLYPDKWKSLAVEEMKKFQDLIMEKIEDDMGINSYPHDSLFQENQKIDWNMPKALFYSLSVLTTIGYGTVTPRSYLGKVLTIGYAILGIPLVVIYLASMGNLLNKFARRLLRRMEGSLLCASCGYCCYNDQRMRVKERIMRKKREEEEFEQQMQTVQHHQEPYYLHSTSPSLTNSASNNVLSSAKVDIDSIRMAPNCATADSSSVKEPKDKDRIKCMGPLLFCFISMAIYVIIGATILSQLERFWTYLEAVYFCFLALTTIGFGDSIPPRSALARRIVPDETGGNLIVWFCIVYILGGMALTAMCFNVICDEIVHTVIHHHNKPKRKAKKIATEDSVSSTKFGSSTNFLDTEAVLPTDIEYPPPLS